jgi:Baseplate J-like protein
MLDLPSIRTHDAEPLTAINPPFKSRIAYRSDDYSSLRLKLLGHLQDAFPNWNGQLANNQGPQDFGVLLVEAFSYLAEILEFYQDCRANESYLRTAVLPGSLIDFCALIDYQIPAGAAAAVLQVFLCKDGQAGVIPAGFQVNTRPKDGQPALVFETAQELKADAAFNTLRLHGYNRSTQHLNATGAARNSTVLLDNGYSGLEAGSYVVISHPDHADYAVRLTAVNEENGKRRITWDATALPADLNLPVADLVLFGNPQQAMRLADSARADEIPVGQLTAEVENGAIFHAGIVLIYDYTVVVFASPGLLQAAAITNVSGNTIHWSRGFSAPLRRSQTILYSAGLGFGWTTTEILPGDRTIDASYLFGTPPVAGDLLILDDGSGVDVLHVASVSGTTYILADGVPRHYDWAKLSKVTLANPETKATGSPHTTFPALTEDPTGTDLTLDRTYQGLKPGVVLVLSDGHQTRVNYVAAVYVDPQNRTVLTLKQALGVPFETATLTIYGPFKLTMRIDGYDKAEGSIPAGLTSLTLDTAHSGLQSGRYLIVESAAHTEGARIAGITRNAQGTVVDLQEPLQHGYPLAETVIYGNVVAATHGETIDEKVLGSGDQSLANQTFALHKKPTTYIHDAEGQRGVTNTLEVFVADEKWTEVESLADSGPDDHHYTVLIDEDELMSIRFGDGRHGAKLPTGRDNVNVRYRVGLGVEGNAGAGEIEILSQPPSFLKSSRNLASASGGAGRPNPEQIKKSAPITVRTLDRAVSVSDYQDLALSFAGIAKARAYWRQDGGRKVVVLVVATLDGRPLSAPLKASLAAFLDARRSPQHAVLIKDHQPYPVRLALTVHVHANFTRAETKQRVEQALSAGELPDGTKGYFHFDRRELGEDVYLSDVYALVEGVSGVDYVVAGAFHAESDMSTAVKDVIRVPDDALATGGSPVDSSIGVLAVQIVGGLA